MGTKILNYPDLNQEQLRSFTKQINSNLLHLYHAHRIVIEDVFEVLKDSIPAEQRDNISTIIGHLDDAIAASVRLRRSFFTDLKHHHESEKCKKCKALKLKKQETEKPY